MPLVGADEVEDALQIADVEAPEGIRDEREGHELPCEIRQILRQPSPVATAEQRGTAGGVAQMGARDVALENPRTASWQLARRGDVVERERVRRVQVARGLA